jgi:predicted glycoside hydrolase/deacetylase ChbG (UPF0249 family)
VDRPRYLTIIADDYGIGPATSQGILDLADQRRLGGAVLLVNSPYAEPAVRAWRQSGLPLELGWHPCLTLDRPVLPMYRVPSLVDGDGRFYPLGRFLRRLLLGQVRRTEIAAELTAQYRRFHELVGRPPGFVNAHHHVHVFPPVGAVLLEILQRTRPLAYLRKVREPWQMLRQIPGARPKRALLSLLGRRFAARQDEAGLPGNDWLAGITDPPYLGDPEFFVRWIRHVPGRVVELACHPGHLDQTLIGRDCTLNDGMLQRRRQEFGLLRQPEFLGAVAEAGFTLTTPGTLTALATRGTADAA